MSFSTTQSNASMPFTPHLWSQLKANEERALPGIQDLLIKQQTTNIAEKTAITDSVDWTHIARHVLLAHWQQLVAQNAPQAAWRFLESIQAHPYIDDFRLSLAGAQAPHPVALPVLLRMFEYSLAWNTDTTGKQAGRALCMALAPEAIAMVVQQPERLPFLDAVLAHLGEDATRMTPVFCKAWLETLPRHSENPGSGPALCRLLGEHRRLDLLPDTGAALMQCAGALLEAIPWHRDLWDAVDWLITLGADTSDIDPLMFPQTFSRILRHPERVSSALVNFIQYRTGRREDGAGALF